jgi:hypothetical protein
MWGKIWCWCLPFLRPFATWVILLATVAVLIRVFFILPIDILIFCALVLALWIICNPLFLGRHK